MGLFIVKEEITHSEYEAYNDVANGKMPSWRISYL